MSNMSKQLAWTALLATSALVHPVQASASAMAGAYTCSDEGDDERPPRALTFVTAGAATVSTAGEELDRGTCSMSEDGHSRCQFPAIGGTLLFGEDNLRPQGEFLLRYEEGEYEYDITCRAMLPI
jgi:hypothetical protein